ncbi:hypothetical protein E1A91_A03G137500v1 [Gossypium mustelinum]|uniref:Uncharacterized protein n=1 Tax=Gossypium mustelinum TaxID=34275 RepID=A0A5D2ZW05_GOSMU|nr:hypothetical protein E1A91_A03G137500v1 [Gossypium mustelinum]
MVLLTWPNFVLGMIMKEVVQRTQNTFGVQCLALQFEGVTLSSVLRKVRIVRQWVLFR